VNTNRGGRMLRVLKVRLYPNIEQQQKIFQHFGSCRYVYNVLLDAKIKAYECGDNLSIYELKKRLVPMKKAKGGEWLREVDSTALQNSILNIGKAYDNFFRRVKKGEAKVGFPKFKSKHNPRQNYSTSGAKRKDGKIYLPKIGLVKAKMHRNIEGIIKTSTVSYEAGQFHISMNIEDGKESAYGTNNSKTIGVDVGVKVFAYTSDGEAIKHVPLKKEIADVVKAQKTLSRRLKGGKNRAKAKATLAKKHLKLRNKRDDFLHKVTNRLSENQAVKVENLNIKNMTKKAKGSIDNPNMRSSAKRGLNHSILKQSWGKFFELLEYKLTRNGGKLIKVDPKFTSQKCSKCGHISKESRKSQSKFVCTVCNHTKNADYNASINILNSHAVGTTV